MKKQTQQYYMNAIKSYIFKRILISCLGLSGVLFFLLTVTVFRGNTLETRVVIGLGYGLISILAVIAFIVYKVQYAPVKVQILVAWQRIKGKRLYIQKKSRSLKKEIHREDYGFQTASLKDLAH